MKWSRRIREAFRDKEGTDDEENDVVLATVVTRWL